MSGQISVLLADNHRMVRDAIARWLETTGDITSVARVSDAEGAILQAAALQPNVVLMDIDMPGLDSFQAAMMIATRSPGTRVVFLSAFLSDRYVDLALAVKASGYILKSESLETLADAIRTAAAGRMYFSPEVQDRIVFDSSNPRLASEGQSRASTLTRREVEIIRYIAQGLSNKEIARTARISEKTVARHIENLMQKLALRGRVDLTRFAIQEGLATT